MLYLVFNLKRQIDLNILNIQIKKLFELDIKSFKYGKK